MRTQSRAITIAVAPGEALATAQLSVRAAGFRAGEAVRLTSRLVDDLQVEWTAHGEFVADADGIVDVHTAPSEGGTFSGLDPAGLLWSMRPTQGGNKSFLTNATDRSHRIGQPACDPLKPLVIELSAMTDDRVGARTRVVLHRLDSGIEALPVRDGALRGMAFRWRDRSRRRGAIMSLTGSSGGVELSYAPLLASLGYDVLSLAYFAYEDLPATLASIPLEYFADGIDWMRKTFGAAKIGVQGASRGGELSLVLAAYLPDSVDGAVAIVPMHAASEGWAANAASAPVPSWTLGGKDIPYLPPLNRVSIEEMQREGETAPNGYALTPRYLAELARPEVRETCAIPVERAKGPLLLISGIEDQMWPSSWGSDLVVNRLRANGFAHAYRHLALPETGHITPLPNAVTTFCPALFHALAKAFLACGGTPQGSARSSRLTWDAIREHYRALFGY